MTTTRTYEYEARTPDLAHMRSLSGLEYLAGILRGDFPAAPIAATLNFAPVEFAHGTAAFEGTPERFTYNPLGTVHGGWAATILDSAMGCAVHTTLPAGKGYTTVDLHISLVRALSERTGRVRCEAKVLHTGSSIVTAEGRIIDAAGTLYATGTTTCVVLGAR
ncbi:MAG: PaaI family thioesterase [Deltaproteobacteria bacterium]|nr:PaaI family thioesterase [Deltaproteobacteria bacterium]